MRKSIGSYTLTCQIYDGRYGSVWQGRQSDDRIVAIRVVPRHADAAADRLRREIRILKKVNHCSILTLCGVMKSSANFYLVVEHCNGGNLSMYSRYQGPVSENVALQCLAQIAGGLRALHNKAIVHTRLCPKSILINTSAGALTLKISNLGNACFLKADGATLSDNVFSSYFAPEILRQQVFGTKADMWSAGLIFHQLLHGKLLFSGEDTERLLADIDGFDRVKWSTLDGADMSSSVQQVMWALLKKTPSVRISSGELVNHPLLFQLARSADSEKQANCKQGKSPKEIDNEACTVQKLHKIFHWDALQIPLAFLAHHLLKRSGWDMKMYAKYCSSMLSRSMHSFSSRRDYLHKTLAACAMGLCLLCISTRFGLSLHHAKSFISSPRFGSSLQFFLSRLSIAGSSRLVKAMR